MSGTKGSPVVTEEARGMKLRRRPLIMLGVLAAVVVALAVFIRGGANTVCPAVGHAYTGDAELVFANEPTSVSACSSCCW